MAAYLIADIRIVDAEVFEEYRRLVPSVIAVFGGRYLVRGGEIRTLEGDVQPGRTVILEFPSMGDLNDFYVSPEYAPLKALRTQSSDCRIFAVEGL